jgi:site-specific recombinase XerD
MKFGDFCNEMAKMFAKCLHIDPLFAQCLYIVCTMFAQCLYKNHYQMAIFSFYLDTRRNAEGKAAAIKIRYTKDRKAAYMPTEISVLPEQWDSASQSILNHPRARMLNAQLSTLLDDVEREYRENREKYARLTASEVMKKLRSAIFFEEEEKPQDLFLPHYLLFIEKKEKERTKQIYRDTLARMRSFCDVDNLCFSEITIDWLRSFEKHLTKTSPSANARSIHFRNIRAVFNDAIDEEVTTHYPFRKFKIKKEATVKRSYSVEELARLFSADVGEDTKYQDMLKLIFYLIGINLIDLYGLKQIESGRVNYHREKTYRLYSIKVEKEAMEIIEKYKGKDYLLNLGDHYAHYRNYNSLLTRACKRIGKKIDEKVFGKLSVYWMRHTWATLAAELDIPKETIAAALGHGGNDITDIYIRFDQKKVDKANRQVIDFVNKTIKKHREKSETKH